MTGFRKSAVVSLIVLFISAIACQGRIYNVRKHGVKANKKDNDGSTTQLYDDAGTTVDQKQSTSESGGTVTKGEWATGP